MFKIGRYQVTQRRLVIFFSAAMVSLNLYSLAWFSPPMHVYRGAFLTTFVILAYLLYPPKSKIGRIAMSVFTLMAVVGTAYPMVFYERLTDQVYFASEIDVYFCAVCLVGFAGVLTRVPGGWIIVGLLGAGVLYLLFGHYVPGVFGHNPFPLTYVASSIYTSGSIGLFGGLTGIASGLISIFIIFAVIIMTAGLGDLITAVVTRIAGNTVGGPGKIAIFSSGAFGMISGSAVANVSSTGPFTIPIMKRIGYEAKAAASVEALASSGGGLVPPIMASAGFIMAELVGLPYLHIMVATIVPAFLWYFTLFISAHYYALRHNVKKWQPPKEEFTREIREKWHLILALIVLVVALVYFVSAAQGAFWAVVFLVVLSSVRKGTRLYLARIVEIFERYARLFTPLFLLIAGLAVFISAFMGSGANLKLGNVLLGGIGEWYVVLLIASVLVILFGMAVPVTSAYLTAVVIIAPVLGRMGYDLLVVHFFVLFLAVLAPVTPPVCLASFAAAKIADADMMKTGLEGARRGLPLWIIPFSFVKKGLILGAGTALSALAIGIVVLCFGIFMFVLGSEGYFRQRLSMLERASACVIGLMVVQPISNWWSLVFVAAGMLWLAYRLVAVRLKRSPSWRG